jgi:amino acid adenylation domain-containing protein
MKHAHTAPQLHDLLKHNDAIALVCGKNQLTHGEIDRRSNALAHTLVGRGIQRGDRVIVFADNTVETVVSFWAVLKANAIASIINPLTKPDKLAYVLNDCRAKAMIGDPHTKHALEEATKQAPHLSFTLLAGRDDVFANEADSPPPRRSIDIDLAAIVYTSGSTGDPKGVMLTHRNMLTAAASISTYLELREDDVIGNVLPLAFDYGLYQMIMAARVGARLVLERSFTYPVQVLELLQNEKVTVFPGVPTIFALLGEVNTTRWDFRRVRTVTNTAAALTPKHIATARRVFPNARVFSMYGLTECKRCTYLPPEDIDRKPTSVGIAIPNTELWLVDENDRRIREPNTVGQLVIRGATVMKGYWEKPEETARKLRPHNGELVLYTGDLCKLDEEGYLYFVARMDDIIKSRGEKVSPIEVERAITQIEGVRECAVVGTPDEVLGQAIKAFVVLEAGATLTEREVTRQAATKLETFMVPKWVVIVPELPKGMTGKIQKTSLK